MQLTQILLSILWHFCTKGLPLAQPSLQTLGYLGPKVSYILGLLKTDFKPWYADLSILEAYLGHFNAHLALWGNLGLWAPGFGLVALNFDLAADFGFVAADISFSGAH